MTNMPTYTTGKNTRGIPTLLRSWPRLHRINFPCRGVFTSHQSYNSWMLWLLLLSISVGVYGQPIHIVTAFGSGEEPTRQQYPNGSYIPVPNDGSVNDTQSKVVAKPTVGTPTTLDHTISQAQALITANAQDSALSYLVHARLLAQKNRDTTQLAVVQLLIGSAHYSQFSYRKGIEAWKRALALFDAIGDTVNYAKAASNLGAAYLAIGYHRSAYDLFAESYYVLPDSLQYKEPGHIATLNMGVALISIGQHKKASDIFQILLKEDISDHVALLCYLNQGEIALAENDTERLTYYIEQAKQLLPQFEYYTPQLERINIESLLLQDSIAQVKVLLQQAWEMVSQKEASCDYLWLDLIDRYEAAGGTPFIPDTTIRNLLDDKTARLHQLATTEKYYLYHIWNRRLADKGDFESAYTFLQQADSIEAAIIDSQQQTAMFDFAERYENDLKTKKIQFLVQDLSDKKRTIGLTTGVIGVLLILLIALLRYHVRLRDMHNSLFEKNKEWRYIFQSIVKNEDQGNRGDNDDKEDIEHEVWQKVQHHFNEEEVFRRPDLKADELAQLCGTNKTYLYNAVKRFSGKSLNELINLYRIEAAKQLMSKDNLSITTIAELSGFNSKSTFYRVFKSETGLSPGEFLHLAKR